MSTNSPPGNIDGRTLIAAILFFTAGTSLTLALCWGQEVSSAYLAITWPTAQGTIISSGTIDSCKGHHGLRPDVRYTYIVAGHRYTESRIAFGPNSCLAEARAAKVAALYPVGNVSVRFNPRHAEQAVLLVGDVMAETWSGIYWSLAVCIASLLLGIWCIRKAEKTERRWNATGS